MNAKRIYRLYSEEQLIVRTKQRRKIARRQRGTMAAATAANQCWSMDFMSDKLTDGRSFRILTVVDQFNLPEAKTKGLAGALRKLGVGKSVLVVSENANRDLELSSRNIQGCDLVRHYKVHPYEVLSHERLLISEGALTRLTRALG